MPPPPIGIGGSIVLSSCPSVRACVRAPVRTSGLVEYESSNYSLQLYEKYHGTLIVKRALLSMSGNAIKGSL